VIPDLHVPFQHPDSFDFLREVKDKYLDDFSIPLNLGDEIDGAKINFHDKDPDLPFSPSEELERSIEIMSELHEMFPHMYLCESNHGSLVYRRQKWAGLPKQVIRTYAQILKTPKWEWHEDFFLHTKLGGVYICHGKTSVNGKLSKMMGCSSIQGHYHSKFQIIWDKTATRDIFDVFSGCLVDRESMAFSYGKNNIPKPILGCTLITESGYPHLIKMITDKKERWTGELP